MTGGYVVTKPFNPATVAVPDWVLSRCRREVRKNEDTDRQGIEVTSPATLTNALAYLLAHEKVDEGGRNDAINKVANKLYRDGLSKADVSCLVRQFNDSKVNPPLDEVELERTIRSATARSEQQGVNSPQADFSPVKDVDIAETLFPDAPVRSPLEIQAARLVPASEIPKRRWLLGHHLLVDKVSVTIAPPGAGKSTWALAMALAVITGREDITGLPVHERGPALIINNEDDQDELNRRLAALCQFWGVYQEDIEGQLFIYSGVHRPFIIAGKNTRGAIKPVDQDRIVDIARTSGIKVVVVDPFLETHEVDENSNEEINKVARLYREVAVETHCAVQIIHHTRKQPAGSSAGHAGNMESGRGASSLSGVARIMNTLYSMSEKDAANYGIASAERHRYARLDDAKGNLSLVTNNARWFYKATVTLGNGDDVGILEPVKLELAVEVEKELWLRALIPHLELHAGEMSARQAAQAIVDDPLVGIGMTAVGAQKRLTAMLSVAQACDGWEIWHEHDPQRAAGTARATHFVYGRRTMEPIEE